MELLQKKKEEEQIFFKPCTLHFTFYPQLFAVFIERC